MPQQLNLRLSIHDRVRPQQLHRGGSSHGQGHEALLNQYHRRWLLKCACSFLAYGH